MRRVYPPRHNRPDRVPECAEVLEPAFMQVVERAEDAGWTRDEILRAASLLATQGLEAEPAAAGPLGPAAA